MKINEKENQDNDTASRKQGFVVFLRLNTWILAPLLAGIGIGRLVDNSFETDPWGVLFGVVIGFIVSVNGLSVESRRINKEEKEIDNR